MSSRGPGGAYRVLRDLGEKFLPFSVRTTDNLKNSLIGAILWRGSRRWHNESLNFGKIIWLKYRDCIRDRVDEPVVQQEITAVARTGKVVLEMRKMMLRYLGVS